MGKYTIPCCDFMRTQLEYKCEKHQDCPDVIIKLRRDGGRLLVGRNASYECNYCPNCGRPQPLGKRIYCEHGVEGGVSGDCQPCLERMWKFIREIPPLEEPKE